MVQIKNTKMKISSFKVLCRDRDPLAEALKQWAITGIILLTKKRCLNIIIIIQEDRMRDSMVNFNNSLPIIKNKFHSQILKCLNINNLKAIEELSPRQVDSQMPHQPLKISKISFAINSHRKLAILISTETILRFRLPLTPTNLHSTSRHSNTKDKLAILWE